MGFDIQGKTALVTGANRGIGKAIVESFIKNGAAKVYAAVRDPGSAKPLVDQFGSKVVPIKLDLSDAQTILDAAKQTTDVQVVVNNAGILKPASPLDDHAIQTLLAEFDVNVFGLLRVAQAFAGTLKANGGGAFVQLNSVVSIKSFPDFSTYCASKAAAYSLTQSLRDKLGEQGTAVLSVHPGPIATDMAATAGLQDVADPPSVVGDGIVAALKAGDFHLFPDTMARQIGGAYQSFAESIVEADLMEA